MSTAAPEIHVRTPEGDLKQSQDLIQQHVAEAGATPETQPSHERVANLAEKTGGQPASAEHTYDTTKPHVVDEKAIVNEEPATLKQWADPKVADLSKPRGWKKALGEGFVFFKALMWGNKEASTGTEESKDSRGLWAEKILKQGDHSGASYDVAERKK